MVRVTWFRHRLMYKVLQALVDRECYFHLATALSWRHTAPCRSRSTTPPSNTQGPSRHVRAVPFDTTRPQMEKPAPTPRLWHPPCDPRTSPPSLPPVDPHSLTHPPHQTRTPAKAATAAATASYAALKEKRAWDLAVAPAKSLPMQAFMLYMSGGGVQIFSMGIVLMLLLSPIKNIAGMNAAFAAFAPSTATGTGAGAGAGTGSRTTAPASTSTATALPLQKLTYIVCNLLTLFVGLWKCRSMGLLPTGTGDWLAFETRGVVRPAFLSLARLDRPRLGSGNVAAVEWGLIRPCCTAELRCTARTILYTREHDSYYEPSGICSVPPRAQESSMCHSRRDHQRKHGTSGSKGAKKKKKIRLQFRSRR